MFYYIEKVGHIAHASKVGSKIYALKISMPSLAEQQQIVQEIESRLSVCDKIEETITDSLRQAEALRQSILKKAKTILISIELPWEIIMFPTMLPTM